jgi:choline-glycine betaine transporter
MSKLITAGWSGLSSLQKVLMIAVLPLVILLIFTPYGRSFLTYMERRTRSKVDKESASIDEKIKQQEADTNRAQGRLENLEKEKEDAIQKAKTDSAQQAVDFWNSRPVSPDK